MEKIIIHLGFTPLGLFYYSRHVSPPLLENGSCLWYTYGTVYWEDLPQSAVVMKWDFVSRERVQENIFVCLLSKYSQASYSISVLFVMD